MNRISLAESSILSPSLNPQIADKLRQKHEDSDATIQKYHDLLRGYGLTNTTDISRALGRLAPRIVMENRDVGFFATYYIRPYVRDWMAVPAKHDEVYEWLKSFNRLLLEAARDFSKSTIASLIWPLFKIITNRNIRILHIAGSGNMGAKFSRYVAWHLEHNERMIRDFGQFRDRKSVWQEQKFCVIRPTEQKEPTWQSIGWMSAVVGGRYDLIILDDVEDYRNTKNPDERRHRLTWLENDILPMLKGGQFIVVQPYQGPGDLHRMLRKKEVFEFKKIPAYNDKGESTWETRMPRRALPECPHKDKPLKAFPCEQCSEYCTNQAKKIICGYCRENCKKCPVLDIPDIVCLTYKEKEVGRIMFRRQYQLDEEVDNEKIFTASRDFKWYKKLPFDSYRVVHGYDLATGKSEEVCGFGYTRLYISNSTGEIFVEHAKRYNIKFPAQVSFLINIHQAFKKDTTVHGIESNAYQVVLAQFIASISTIPVKEVITTQDKITRAINLSVFFDNKRIWLKGGEATADLEDELENFEEYGLRYRKDVFDSFFIALQADGIRGENILQDASVVAHVVTKIAPDISEVHNMKSALNYVKKSSVGEGFEDFGQGGGGITKGRQGILSLSW